MNGKKQNRLQMPTWNWLGVNQANLAIQAQGGCGKEPALSGAEGVRLDRGITPGIIPGLPPDLETARVHGVKHHNVALTVEIPEGLHLHQPILIEFDLDEQHPYLYDYIDIRAGKNSRATVVLSYRCDGADRCHHTGFTCLDAEEGAEIRLLKSQLLGSQATHEDITAARLRQGAQAEILLGELGGIESVAGCNILLEGEGSRAQLDSMYLGSGKKKQDLSYRIEYRGRNTEGNITVKGALAGETRKVLKSTIDFVTGASGAKGREEEAVLVLDKRVVNISAPLLLCGEDNVEGEHATNTGRPDGGKLFYLMSRGLSEPEARKLLVEAAFAPLLNKVEENKLREDMLLRIREVIHSEQ